MENVCRPSLVQSNLTLHSGAVTIALPLRSSGLCCMSRAAGGVCLLQEVSVKPSHYGCFPSNPDPKLAGLETLSPGHSPGLGHSWSLLWEQHGLEHIQIGWPEELLA